MPLHIRASYVVQRIHIINVQLFMAWCVCVWGRSFGVLAKITFLVYKYINCIITAPSNPLSLFAIFQFTLFHFFLFLFLFHFASSCLFFFLLCVVQRRNWKNVYIRNPFVSWIVWITSGVYKCLVCRNSQHIITGGKLRQQEHNSTTETNINTRLMLAKFFNERHFFLPFFIYIIEISRPISGDH